jgi:hypothetical protein
MRTWLFPIALAATLLLPVPSVRAQGGAQVGCIGHRFLFVPNGITYVEGNTRVGQPCQVAFGLMGADIEVLQIIVRPLHGVLGASEKEANRRYIAYAPSAGFVGRDRFEVHIQYAPPNRPRLTTRVKVEMNVTP